jgi:hypothetical protein
MPPGKDQAMLTNAIASPVSKIEVRFRRVSGITTCSLDRLSVDEVLAGCPVRAFRWFRGRRFYSGWYWSATMRGLVAYKSRLERGFCWRISTPM